MTRGWLPSMVWIAGLATALLMDFYNNRFAPYSYDFSIMSKHALSRIYEHYTALLHVAESAQMTFFARLPEEEWNKRHGSIYTPQFIARYLHVFCGINYHPGSSVK